MNTLESTARFLSRTPGASATAHETFSCTAVAPGKVILFGEHAINRGQPAIAASVGLYVRCTASLKCELSANKIHFQSQSRQTSVTVEEIMTLRDQVETWRASRDFEAIRSLKAKDFFAPQKYVLACAWGTALPAGLHLSWQSEVPPASGLGSGGSAFTAMVVAVAELIQRVNAKREGTRSQPDVLLRADWAHRGDIIAHGGVASALDTQTSLLGGVIRYTGAGLAQPVNCPAGLCLVIAWTGIGAPTSEVNNKVRLWLDEAPQARLNYFQAIGDVTAAGLIALESGDWAALGRWMTLNQLALDKIGVSCSEATRLIEVALEAGAYGAKVSGSGGGGIIIALVSKERKAVVATALAAIADKVFTPDIGVPGVSIRTSEN